MSVVYLKVSTVRPRVSTGPSGPLGLLRSSYRVHSSSRPALDPTWSRTQGRVNDCTTGGVACLWDTSN